jgi:hypothetical protein
MPGAEMVFGEFDPDCAAIVYPAPPPTNNATLAATATGASQERLEIGATLIASDKTDALRASKSGLAKCFAGSFAVNATQAWSLSVPLNSFDMIAPLFLPFLCQKRLEPFKHFGLKLWRLMKERQEWRHRLSSIRTKRGHRV